LPDKLEEQKQHGGGSCSRETSTRFNDFCATLARFATFLSLFLFAETPAREHEDDRVCANVGSPATSPRHSSRLDHPGCVPLHR